MLTDLGLNDLTTIAVGIAILVVIFFLVLIFSMKGGAGKLVNLLYKRAHKNVITKHLPELEKIANEFPADPVGIQARKFLDEWEEKTKPSLEKMTPIEREKKLVSTYQTRVLPIIKQNKRMAKIK